MSVGGTYTCAVTPADVVYCWGANAYGQLGNGTTSNYWMPFPVSGVL